jgi:hypothetical protein
MLLLVRPARFELATYGFVALISGHTGRSREMGVCFFQFVDQMLTKIQILGLFKISKSIA